MQFETTETYARYADESDVLKPLRGRYHHPTDSDGNRRIYLTGHSLGLQPIEAESEVENVMRSWRDRGVDAHFDGPDPWLHYAERMNGTMADLVGARPDEVAIMNALSVNLHLLLAAFYRPTPSRYRILMERGAFPSDRYVVESQVRWHGRDPHDTLLYVGTQDDAVIRTEDVVQALRDEGSEIAVVFLGGVNYLTGQRLDMETIARAAREAGCVCGFDLAHAAGNVPIELHAWQVDFAAWCTYKYLNGGPGSPGAVFVHSNHHGASGLLRLRGWWGQEIERRFRMLDEYEPARGAAAWQISNPSILSLAPLRAALDHFSEAGFDRLCDKSRGLTEFLASLVEKRLPGRATVLTPGNPDERGAQVSIRVKYDARAVAERLHSSGVVCDWRHPGIIRMAPVPLYNSYMDVYLAVERLEEAVSV